MEPAVEKVQHEPQCPCDLTVHHAPILSRQSTADGGSNGFFQPDERWVAEQFCGVWRRAAWNSSHVSSENSLSAAVHSWSGRALISATLAVLSTKVAWRRASSAADE